MPEFRVGTQHTAGAHDAGRAQQLRLHLLAAGLQLCRQLFQLQQFSSTLGSALGGKTGGVGGFGSVQSGVLAGAAGGFAGFGGLGADGGHGLTGRGAFPGGVPRFGGGKLELQPSLVQFLVGGQGGGAQQLGHSIADGVDAVAQLLHGVQRIGQCRGGNGGSHHVHRIHGVQKAHEDDPHKGRDEGYKVRHHRVHDAHDHQRAHAPQQAEFQADIAPDVKGEIAVIPPTSVIELIQRPAAHQLQRTGQDDAAEIQQQDAVLQGRKRKQHNDHAKAVDGADRAIQKAPVHQLTGGGGGIDDLQTPAHAGIDQEIGQNMVQREPTYHSPGEKTNHEHLRSSVLFGYDLIFVPRLKKGTGSGTAGKIARHFVLVQRSTLRTVIAAVLVLNIIQAQLTGVRHFLRLPVRRLRRRQLPAPSA